MNISGGSLIVTDSLELSTAGGITFASGTHSVGESAGIVSFRRLDLTGGLASISTASFTAQAGSIVGGRVWVSKGTGTLAGRATWGDMKQMYRAGRP